MTQTVERKAKKSTEPQPLPATMRAAAIDHYGGPEVLTLHERPVPELAAKEVLIAVHTAGVGGWDADIRDGWNPGGPVRFPLVLGTDGSGTIAQLGPRARRFKQDRAPWQIEGFSAVDCHPYRMAVFLEQPHGQELIHGVVFC